MSDNRPRRLAVILSEAKNLINLDTYAFEILRLTPQNDIVGQHLWGDFETSIEVTFACSNYF